MHQILLTLLYHSITHVYHMCAGGGGERVYGKMDYYPDEKKKGGGKKSDLWLIHYLLTKFPPPARVCLCDPSPLLHSCLLKAQ